MVHRDDSQRHAERAHVQLRSLRRGRRGDRILPALVDQDAAINILVDDEEELDPAEEVTRRLAFPYPEDRLPTRLSCGEAVFELALKP